MTCTSKYHECQFRNFWRCIPLFFQWLCSFASIFRSLLCFPSYARWHLYCCYTIHDFPLSLGLSPSPSLWCVSWARLEPGRQPCPSAPSIKQWAGWQRGDDGRQRRGRCFAGTDTCSRPQGMSLRRRQRIMYLISGLLSQGHWLAVTHSGFHSGFWFWCQSLRAWVPQMDSLLF